MKKREMIKILGDVLDSYPDMAGGIKEYREQIEVLASAIKLFNSIIKDICNLVMTDTISMSRGAEILNVSIIEMREILKEEENED